MRRVPGLTLALFLALGVPSAFATTIRVDFTGTLGLVPDQLEPTLDENLDITGTFFYDDSVAPIEPNNGEQTVFIALQGVTFSIGSFSASFNGADGIQVDNNGPVEQVNDRFFIGTFPPPSISAPLVNGFALDFFGLRLDDTTNTAIASALTLPSSLSFSDFTSGAFILDFIDPQAPTAPFITAEGRITGVTSTVAAVPEPGTFLLVGTGLAAAYRARRRRR